MNSAFLLQLHKLNIQFYLVTFLVIFLSYNALAQTSTPNIVVIMADDLGYYDIGFNRIHRPDNPDYGIIPTPNIDRVAQSGVTFTRGYAAHPFCGPSRAALMTGRYHHEIGSQYNIMNGSVDCNGTKVGIPLGPESEFFSTALQQQGNYDTYMIGKWHLGDAQQHDPISRGFNEYYGFLGGGHQYFPAGDPSQGINSSNDIAANQNNTGINDYFKYIEKNRQWITDESRYVTRALSEEAVNFIKQGKDSNKPFLAYVAYNAPHQPLQAPVSDKDQFLIDNPNFLNNVKNSPDILNAKKVVEAATPAEAQAEIDKLAEQRLTYATMVAIMDEGVGIILDELQSNSNGGSVFDNTIVIFLSDNGGKLREGGAVNYPLDQGKGSLNEGGFRVPFCLSWPDGGIAANTTRDHLVTALDIYPTLLGAANLPIPERLDGENLLNDLASESPTLRNDPFYMLRHFNGFSNVSIFDNIPGSNNKIIKKANGDWKHYDVDSDIAETSNITSAASTTLINRLVPKVRILAEQHIQPLFFDNCGNVFNNWFGKNMPRYKDDSGRADADTPDETFLLSCNGNTQDSDNDGVCDGLDLCPGGDDTIDNNANGIPDACDTCSVGANCNDRNVCTTGDVYDANCNCAGTFADADNDGVCDANDVCAGGDDTIDNNNNGTPDFCDACNPNANLTNAAPAGTASMSSTFNNLVASRLNDDITANNLLAHSGSSSPNEWADIDLGTAQNINQVVVWKRTTCCVNRLNNVYVLVSQNPFPSNTDLTASLANADFSFQLGDVSQQSEVTVPVGQTGQYVRLQKSGNNNGDNILNLKEIQIFVGGSGSGTCDDGDPCTTGDMFDANCNCVGTFADSDNDGICDANDNGNCTPNTSCDDGDPCTIGETFDTNCDCVGGTSNANNTTDSLMPTDDTYIRGGSFENNNFGTVTTMHIKKSNNDKFTRYACLKFDLSQINATQLQSATLRLKVSFNNNTDTQHDLLVETIDNWTETSLTYANNQFGGSNISSFIVPSKDQWIELDVTNAVQTEAGGDGAISFGVVCNQNKIVRYYTKESSGNEPELVLTYQNCNARIGTSDLANTIDPSKNPIDSKYSIVDDALNIYPNPSLDFITIEMNQSLKNEIKQILIYSASGQLLSIKNTNLSERIFVGNLKPGLYILKAQGINSEWHGKFLKK